MLEDIKSIYTLKIIFSFVNEGKKLGIVRHNKNLQKNIDISLVNYQLFSGKYLVYEAGGKVKGKEYDCYNEQLMFEGEYLNGKRNGKGKEYNEEGIDGIPFFEGEYLNGKRNGKGYGFSPILNAIYEGEYLNGVINGKGKEYDSYGNVQFEGKYLNNIRFEGKAFYNGKPLYNLIDGKGKIEKNNFYMFEGEFLNGLKNGKCKEYDDKHLLKFEGEYLNGLRNGKGTEYYIIQNQNLEYITRIKWEGEYLGGKKWNGKGYDRDGNIIYELKNGNGPIKEYDFKANLQF